MFKFYTDTFLGILCFKYLYFKKECVICIWNNINHTYEAIYIWRERKRKKTGNEAEKDLKNDVTCIYKHR